MKKNRPFRLTNKEIEDAIEACILAKRRGGDERTLQRVIDKMAVSQWYSDTQLFSPAELKKRKPAIDGEQASS